MVVRALMPAVTKATKATAPKTTTEGIEMSRGSNRSVAKAVSNSPANIPRLIRLLDRSMADDALLSEGSAVGLRREHNFNSIVSRLGHGVEVIGL